MLLILIIAGTILMTYNILKLKKMTGLLGYISSKTQTTSTLIKTHMGLLQLFLILYFLFLLAVILKIDIIDENLVGAIFILGSVFVFLGLLLQESLLSKISSSYLQTVKVLVSAVEARDPYTMGHSEHVANLLQLIYEHLPENQKDRLNFELIKFTGFLHDIGKIGVPESILNKKQKLTDEEWDLLKNHTSISEKILNNVDDLKIITKWILYHHERIDGKGYYKIVGENIPFVSKMIAVADTYSALVTDRPYREGKTDEEAIKILKEVSGSQLDPHIVDIFCSIDKKAIKECRPEKLYFDLVKDIKKVEEYLDKYSRTQTSDSILTRSTGIVCMKKLLSLAKRNQFNLTVVKIDIPEIKEEKELDYHLVEHRSSDIAKLINDTVRKSDILCRLQRDSFLALLPKCSIEQAKNLIIRIDTKIESSEVNAQTDEQPKIIKTYYDYNPDDEQSFKVLEKYLDGLLSEI